MSEVEDSKYELRQRSCNNAGCGPVAIEMVPVGRPGAHMKMSAAEALLRAEIHMSLLSLQSAYTTVGRTGLR